MKNNKPEFTLIGVPQVEVDRSTGMGKLHTKKKSKEYAIQTLCALKTTWESRKCTLRWWTEQLADAKEMEIWKKIGYETLDEMLLKEIGVTERGAAALLRQRAIDHAAEAEGKKFNKGAGPLSKEEKDNGDIITVNSTGKGTSAEYLTARIKRDHPAILERMKKGEFRSVRAAAVEAGIVKVPTPFERVMRLLPKLKIVELKGVIEAIRHLREDHS